MSQKRFSLVRTLGIIFMLTYIIFIAFPIYWQLNTSFKEIGEVRKIPPTFFPKHFTLSPYVNVMSNPMARKSIYDSLIISITTTLLSVLIGSLAGYAFARYPKYAGGENLSFWMLSVRMFPPIVFILPFFFIFNNLGLTDTYFSLIVMYFTFNLPLSVWLMMMFFGDVPRELEEAAYVDGYKPFKAFFKVTLPLVLPGMVSVIMLCWIFAWNEFLFANVLVGTRVKTFPLVIPTFASGSSILWNQVMAFTVIAMLPPIILFIFLRKYMIRGLSLGVVKG